MEGIRAESGTEKTTEAINELRVPVDSSREEVTEDASRKLERNFEGRRTIYCNLKKDDLNEKTILEVLPEVLNIHNQNVAEIEYLDRYYKGHQPILSKTKVVRPEINNKVLINHAFEIVEFKKAYVYGEPIQYVQKGEKDNGIINPEISLMNKFMESEDKSSLDKELAEWNYKIGTAYRWIDADTPEDEDDAPFEMSVPDPRRIFVVYSNEIKRKQLFSGFVSNYEQKVVDSETDQVYEWQEYMIYTENQLYIYTTKDGGIKLKKKHPLVIKGHRIIEYPLNSSRLGIIELVMSLLNALNRISSADIDDVEQFVQSLLVFVNQDIDAETFKELIALGAISVVSSDPSKPADVKILTNQMSHSETKVVIDELYNSLLTIVGIPKLNDKPSGGDTGQARLLGEGWTMADERAKQDELSFKKSERQMLKTALRICKYKLKGKKENMKNLKISDIDIKFTRNKSDNLLVKTQGLMNMRSAQVDPETAFITSGLFSDPNSVVAKSKSHYGEDFWKEGSKEKVINEPKLDKNIDPNNLPQLGGKKPATQKTTNKSGKTGE